MAVCYRHPTRETGVSCSNCGRPICPECMTSTSVGMRCPECARQTTKVRVGQGAFSPTAGKMPLPAPRPTPAGNMAYSSKLGDGTRNPGQEMA